MTITRRKLSTTEQQAEIARWRKAIAYTEKQIEYITHETDRLPGGRERGLAVTYADLAYQYGKLADAINAVEYDQHAQRRNSF